MYNKMHMNKKVIGAVAVLVFLVGCGGQQDEDVNYDNMAQPSDSAVTYNCEGEEIKADFNNDVDPKTVDLFFIAKDTKITLPNVEAGSGAKYSDGDVSFWTHQGEAILSMESTNNSINCIEEATGKNNEKIVDANGNVVTAGCKTWFDGCNTCQVGDAGMPMACTKMMCAPEIMKPAKCMDEESISQEKQDCDSAGGVWSEEHNSCFEDPATMAGEGEK